MKRLYLILVIFIPLHVFPQNYARLNELELDAEYYFLYGNYEKALENYLSLNEAFPENANIKYKIGICYLNTDDKTKAIPFLEEATEKITEKYNPSSFKEEDAPIETWLILGSAYRIANNLKDAIEAYEKYKHLVNPKDKDNIQLAEHYIQSCYTAKKMMNKPMNLRNSNLGSLINDDKSEFNAVISGNGKILAYNTANRFGYIVNLSKKENGTWTKPKNISGMLGGKYRYKVSSLSYDGNMLFLVTDDPVNSDIYLSTFNRGRWSKAEKMDKPINSRDNETHACISSNGRTLYFTSNRSGGIGDLDIYKSTLNDKGKWEKPENLGSKINTRYNEEAPFLTPDGLYLFFSSEGHKGMGGYDIFYYQLDNPSTQPVNIGYPINTTANDLFYQPGNTLENGYYSIVADDSYGSKDIYQVEILPALPVKVNVKGKLYSSIPKDNFKPEHFAINIADANSFETVANVTPNSFTSEYSVELRPGNYSLMVIAQNHETFVKNISIPEDYPDTEMNVDINMNYTPPVAEIKEEPTIQDSPVSENKSTNFIAEIPSKTEPSKTPKTYTTPITEKKINKSSSQKKPLQTITSINQSAPKTTKAVTNYKPRITTENKTHNLVKYYTIQLMALKRPVDISYFKNIDNVIVTTGEDGYYRYTYGQFDDVFEAQSELKNITKLGHKNAYIKVNNKN